MRGPVAGTGFSLALLAGLLTGCGTPGEPLPPALKRPVRVTDLAAAERGANIVITFTIPTVTTENLPVGANRDIELRMGGPDPDGFHLENWEKTSDRISGIAGDKPTAHVEVPVAKYVGKTVVVGVNVHGPHGRTAGWSIFRTVQVVPPLPQPEALEVADAPDAVHLTWHAAAGAFRIFRRTAGLPETLEIGTSPKPDFSDTTIEYGKAYTYTVQSTEKTSEGQAESDISDPTTIKPVDKFPPSVPSALTAIPGARTIELVWDRNVEKDLAGYVLYRNGQKVTTLTAPSYTDRDVQPGSRYSYRISAIDNAGNESAQTPETAATIP
jgi:hypothetical protein